MTRATHVLGRLYKQGDSIYATIHPDNAASIHVATKLGFRYDRQEIDDDGIPTHYYVIERSSASR